MRFISVAFVVLAMTLLLAGCAEQGAQLYDASGALPSDPAAVYKHTKIETDEAVGITRVVGPLVYERHYPITDTYLVRAHVPLKQKPPEGSYQVYVEVYADDWLFLKQAYSHGNELKTKLIDRQAVHCSDRPKEVCRRTETVGVNVSHQELQTFANTGFDFKIVGRRGSRTFSIPSAYFQAFLLRLRELEG